MQLSKQRYLPDNPEMRVATWVLDDRGNLHDSGRRIHVM